MCFFFSFLSYLTTSPLGLLHLLLSQCQVQGVEYDFEELKLRVVWFFPGKKRTSKIEANIFFGNLPFQVVCLMTKINDEKKVHLNTWL